REGMIDLDQKVVIVGGAVHIKILCGQRTGCAASKRIEVAAFELVDQIDVGKYRRVIKRRLAAALPLVVAKEKRLVSPDRPAESEPELVLVKFLQKLAAARGGVA